jgi:osmotically-inducible protein OsmY
MELDFRSPRTNEENRDEILAAINRDAYLTGLPITVRVAGEVATLEGTVGNAYEKDRAERDAHRVGSVVSVQNRLAVNWLDERGVRARRPMPRDDDVRRAIRDSLDQDLRLTRPGDIIVKVADRFVTLEGSAPDYYQATIARQDSQDAIGAVGVDDRLEIGSFGLDDQAVAEALERSLSTDYYLADDSIGVSVDEGVTILTGEVRSTFEWDHAEEIAAAARGVRGVINGLVVRPAVGHSDEALREIIEARLTSNWKTSRVVPRIHVVVEDGSATLTGEVDTWPELLEAGRVTRLVDGVTDVTNSLSLTGVDG